MKSDDSDENEVDDATVKSRRWVGGRLTGYEDMGDSEKGKVNL